jgi:hypothetical protein
MLPFKLLLGCKHALYASRTIGCQDPSLTQMTTIHLSLCCAYCHAYKHMFHFLLLV